MAVMTAAAPVNIPGNEVQKDRFESFMLNSRQTWDCRLTLRVSGATSGASA